MAQTSPVKLVLVEDDATLAEMYVKKFTLEGFAIVRASNGEEGLTVIKREKPLIAMIDIMMPKMNGLDLVKALREDPATKDTFVVLLSNVGEQSYIDEGFRLGANEYLMKSNFTPREVVNKVRGWVKKLAA